MDRQNDDLKKEIRKKYDLLRDEKTETDKVLAAKEQELIDLDQAEEQMHLKYEKLMESMKERI